MNKENAVKCFRDQVMPAIKEDENEYNQGKPWYERREQYWLMFMKIALDRGWITREKYERWTTPPFCNPRYDSKIQRN